ncbi:NlpC/P60 family protein [Streptomyces sp. NPDC014991]|uniref:C40 family peptidase n=1 Tax=Streptomyces sp. NPDC014991 TaxID=3364935 RepID=UPI0036F8131D
MAPESRDEVRQRIESLYDQAENATGNFNATRAMAAQRRSRGVPLAKRTGRRPEPALDTMARQWFDAARAKLGPTVPALLPPDRLPDRPTVPTRPQGRDGDGDLAGGVREALPPGPSAHPPRALERGAGGAIGALPVGSSGVQPGGGQALGELTGGSAGNPWSAEGTGVPGGGHATGGPVAVGAVGRSAAMLEGGQELPNTALPQRQLGHLDLMTVEATGRSMPELAMAGGSVGLPDFAEQAPAGVGAAGTALLPAAAPPTAQANPVQIPRPLPGAAPGRPSPTVSKADSRRKLTAARDLLTRYTSRPALTTDPVRPAFTQAGWNTGAQPPHWATSTAAPGVPPLPETPSAAAVPDVPAMAAPAVTQTADALPVAAFPAAGTSSYPAMTAPGMTTSASAADTGSYAYPATSAADTGSYAYPATSAADTGSYPHPAASTSVGVAGIGTGSRALRAAKAIAFARAQVGRPCVWGATGPGSYDCSSLVQAAWRAAGVMLPRAAHEQALAGTPVAVAGAEPGDLVLFFDDDRHVGLYVGDGMMVHAPGPGSTIREESVYGAGEAAIHRVVRPA